MTTTTAAELEKLKCSFNPNNSVTFIPTNKKQAVGIEVQNCGATDAAVKFKNTGPLIYRTHPPSAKLGIGEKKIFQCFFRGLPPAECQDRKCDRFTIVYMAVSKNVNIEKAWKNAQKTTNKKHKIAIKFKGMNEEVEKDTQQPTNNEEDEDKDRQGKMRAKKAKSETSNVKKATVVMFMRKEGDSMSDEDDEEGTTPAGEAPGDDMMTTRPAGTFTGQVASNEPAGNPKSEFRTTRPAGKFTGQVASTPAAGGAKDPKSSGLRTTRPAGAFTGQTTSNETTGSTSAENPDFKTTKPAGTFDNPQKNNKK